MILECRVCLNMFRSLANFVAHKRNFCTNKLKSVKHVYRRDPGEVSLVSENAGRIFPNLLHRVNIQIILRAVWRSSLLSESGVRASANAHSRSYMSMHADPS